MKKKHIAIIGGGAAGTVAAWLLRDRHHVTLFEASHYIGGHVYTCSVDAGEEGRIPVDMGVEYFNERVAPNVFNLLRYLGIENYVAPSSFHARFPGEVQYWSNVHYDGPMRQSMQDEFSRFQLGMSEVMSSGDARYKTMSISDYLDENGYSLRFIYQALYPMISISTGCNVDLRSYPLMFFALSFNANLVSFFAPGYWRKVDGGMNRYLQSLADTLGERLRLNTPVQWVKPRGKGVALCHAGKEEMFDAAIFATSAEVALALLAEATVQQREILSHFAYHDIESVAHHDTRYLGEQTVPHYFNFRQFTDSPAGAPVGSVTRVINALSPYRHLTTPLLVTLDPKVPIDPQKRIATCRWRVAQQQPGDFLHKTRLREIQGGANMWFCGVDTSLGGHEGAVVSGMVIADRLGAPYPYKHDLLAYIQFKVTKDIMGVKTRGETLKDRLSDLLFITAKKCALHKSLSYKFIKDFIV
ncbi:FAD-dependent oxidoreductase [Serratia sp. CY85251]|uniref:FAD-dependent oxidoreductase n=1 Tax=Serratia sp. CY85251 TaxID=3383696 RepID=UPI003FA08915